MRLSPWVSTCLVYVGPPALLPEVSADMMMIMKRRLSQEFLLMLGGTEGTDDMLLKLCVDINGSNDTVCRALG